MKKLLLTAALVAILAPAALAQGNRDHDKNQGHQNGAPQGPAAGRSDRDHGPSGGMAGPQTMRRDNGRPPQPAATNRNFAPSMAGPSRMPSPNRTNGPNRSAGRDFSSYHRVFTAPRRFRAPVYHRPPGFYVHHWTFGERLPSAFWVRDYWLSDFFEFGLMPPPPGTVWVRYGSDALLIDEYNGEIIQVDYNVFY